MSAPSETKQCKDCKNHKTTQSFLQKDGVKQFTTCDECRKKKREKKQSGGTARAPQETVPHVPPPPAPAPAPADAPVTYPKPRGRAPKNASGQPAAWNPDRGEWIGVTKTKPAANKPAKNPGAKPAKKVGSPPKLQSAATRGAKRPTRGPQPGPIHKKQKAELIAPRPKVFQAANKPLMMGFSWDDIEKIEGQSFEYELYPDEDRERVVKSGTTQYTNITFSVDSSPINIDTFHVLRVRVLSADGNVGEWSSPSRARKPNTNPRPAVDKKVRRAMWAEFYPGPNDDNVCPPRGSMIQRDCLGCQARGNQPPIKLSPLLDNVHAGHIISYSRGGPAGDKVEHVWDFMPLCKDCNLDMGTKNAIQWFYDECSRKNNFKPLYEVLWRLKKARERNVCHDTSRNIIPTVNTQGLVNFVVTMYHEGHPDLAGGRCGEKKHGESDLCGGFNCALPGQFTTRFEARRANGQQAELVSSDAVKLILTDAFDEPFTEAMKAKIQKRVENEREIERIMRDQAMRLMNDGVDPNSIDVQSSE